MGLGIILIVFGSAALTLMTIMICAAADTAGDKPSEYLGILIATAVVILGLVGGTLSLCADRLPFVLTWGKPYVSGLDESAFRHPETFKHRDKIYKVVEVVEVIEEK